MPYMTSENVKIFKDAMRGQSPKFVIMDEITAPRQCVICGVTAIEG